MLSSRLGREPGQEEEEDFFFRDFPMCSRDTSVIFFGGYVFVNILSRNASGNEVNKGD